MAISAATTVACRIPWSVRPTRVARVVYTTKTGSVFHARTRTTAAEKFSMIGRYGLPGVADTKWIEQIVGPRRLFFIGDADPAESDDFPMAPINTRLEKAHSRGSKRSPLASLSSRFGGSLRFGCLAEIQSMAVLEKVFPDFGSLLGPECAKLLAEKRKIEIEAVISYSRAANGIVRSRVRRPLVPNLRRTSQ